MGSVSLILVFGRNILIHPRARATSAAPPYFKVFRNPRTGSGYLDGAFYYNNPVRIANLERKLIWPDTEHMHPDILVSIGTSLDHSTSTSCSKQSPTFPIPSMTNAQSEGLQKRTTLRHFPQFNNMLNLLLNRADNILNTELAWDSFMVDIKPSKDHEQSRYQRLNPIIQYRPPALDEVHEMDKLQLDVYTAMRRGPQNSMARKVAHRLIASSFFFEKSIVPSAVDETVILGKLSKRHFREDLNLSRGALVQIPYK